MSVHSISTKELRNNMPRVRAGLNRGDQYLVIYRSKPIARLEPIGQKAPVNTKVVGGGLRLQANSAQELTPEYLNQLVTDRYE